MPHGWTLLAHAGEVSIQIKYDIVWGPAATDKAYVAFQLYEIGILHKREMLKYTKKESFPNQILFHTERSLEFCFFKESIFL